MRESSSLTLVVLSLALLLGACTNGGKNVRDTTGMTPAPAAGQAVGAGATTGAAPRPTTGATTSAVPAATGDSITSRRDTLGGKRRP